MNVIGQESFEEDSHVHDLEGVDHAPEVLKSTGENQAQQKVSCHDCFDRVCERVAYLLHRLDLNEFLFHKLRQLEYRSLLID